MTSPIGTRRFTVLFFGLACLMLLSACGDGRRRVYPVTGQIFVDGKPAANAFVYFTAVDDKDPRVVRPFAQADKEGNFALATYVAGDGVPAGDYILTFEWREPSGMFKQDWEGRDKLNGAFMDVKNSKFKVTIEAKPNELGPFHLSTSKSK